MRDNNKDIRFGPDDKLTICPHIIINGYADLEGYECCEYTSQIVIQCKICAKSFEFVELIN